MPIVMRGGGPFRLRHCPRRCLRALAPANLSVTKRKGVRRSRCGGAYGRRRRGRLRSDKGDRSSGIRRRNRAAFSYTLSAGGTHCSRGSSSFSLSVALGGHRPHSHKATQCLYLRVKYGPRRG